VTGEGLTALLAEIETRLNRARDTLDLELQPHEGALSNWIYENCEVVERSDLGDGVTHLRIRVPAEKRHRLARLAGAGRLHIDAAE
jgi:GTP-binding protein HflX